VGNNKSEKSSNDEKLNSIIVISNTRHYMSTIRRYNGGHVNKRLAKLAM
jgi:hypothetical protein